MRIGRTRKELAKLLQKSFPQSASGLDLTWEASQLFPATGAHRTNASIDCGRWEGFARHYRSDGSFYTALSVGSYHTMTELIKAKRLTLIGSEVCADD